MWTYAFNHEEAVACFRRAADADPDCAMAHWGVAYALGPNYNKPWEAFDGEELTTTVEQTHAAVERAHRAAVRATPVERALVEALRARYPQAHAAEDCSVWNEPYADRMLAVYESAPGDPDVAALCADALMNLTPWQLWDLRTGLPADGARTEEAKAVLDGALATEAGAHHPGVVHLYIHLMEMSPTPRRPSPWPTGCAASPPTPGTCSTCPRTWRCCAATTAGSSRTTPPPSPPTRSTCGGRER